MVIIVISYLVFIVIINFIVNIIVMQKIIIRVTFTIREINLSNINLLIIKG